MRARDVKICKSTGSTHMASESNRVKFYLGSVFALYSYDPKIQNIYVNIPRASLSKSILESSKTSKTSTLIKTFKLAALLNNQIIRKPLKVQSL